MGVLDGVYVFKEEGEVSGVIRSIGLNVFDSCVKSCQHFRTVSISLETTVHWLSEKNSQIQDRS